MVGSREVANSGLLSFPHCSFLCDQGTRRHTASLWKSYLEGMQNEFWKASWNLIMHEKYTKGRKEPIRKQLRKLQLQCILIKSKKYQPTKRRQASYLWNKREVEIRKMSKADTMEMNKKGKNKTTFHYHLVSMNKSHVSFKNLFLGHSRSNFCSALLLNYCSSFTINKLTLIIPQIGNTNAQ